MTYSFLKLNEKYKVKKFLNQNWKKNHILVLNKNLFNWQHIFKKKILFYCLRKNNQIISLLGIINQTQNNSFTKQGMGIICSKNKFGIIDILKNFLKRRYNILVAIGLTKEVMPIYNHFKFKTGELNMYYISNPNMKNNTISKNLIKINPNKIKLNSAQSLDISCILNFTKKKDYKYILWRFINHPVYKYKFLMSDDKKLKIIYRDIVIKKHKIIRIVDFFGSFEHQEQFIKSLLKFCIVYKYNHIEMLHFGYEDKFIKKTIFKKKYEKEKLPYYVEPFDNLKKQSIYFAYKSKLKGKIKIVRADADADRPNKI